MTKQTFTPKQLDDISTASTVSASFSLVGALLMIVLFLFGHVPNRSGRTFFSKKHMLARLAFCMAISDVVSSVAYVIGRRAIELPHLCTAQAFLEQLGDLSSILFTGKLL
jgi:hypothetical protein